MWVTLNEPWVVTDGGYLHGALAPGHRSQFEAPIASHNLMRAHGEAVQAYRASGKHQIGLVVNIEPKYPASRRAHDRAATRARRCLHEPAVPRPGPARPLPATSCARSSARRGRSGRRDDIGADHAADRLRRHQLLHAQRRRATTTRRGRCSAAPVRQQQATYTETGWEVFPQGLTDTLVVVQAALRRHAALRHRERRRVLRSAGGRRRAASTTRCACDYLRKHLRAVARGDRAGRRRARLLRVVAARQPRVVARLLQALRHRARRTSRRRSARRRTARGSTPT